MGKQFSNVSSKYGAPMGRSSYPLIEEGEILLFEVQFVDSDYDDGGAYWGSNSRGEVLYCARDEEGNEAFARASSKTDAIRKLKLDPNRIGDSSSLEYSSDEISALGYSEEEEESEE